MPQKDTPSIEFNKLNIEFSQQVTGNWALKFIQAFFIIGLLSFFLKLPVNKISNVAIIGPVLQTVHTFLVNVFTNIVGITLKWALLALVIGVCLIIFWAMMIGAIKINIWSLLASILIIGVLVALIFYMPQLLPSLVKQAPPVTQTIFGGP